MKLTIILLFFCVSTAIAQEDSNENDPCSLKSYGLVIHFLKSTDSILETPCDSIQHLINYIRSDDFSNYYLIGIASDKSPEEKFKAKHRAEILKEKLIENGVDPDRLQVTFAVHQKPKKGESRDWPYYPESFEHEIGVFLERVYE